MSWQDAIDKLPEISSWEAWGEIFLDVPTWSPLVEEICRRAGLPCRRIEAGYPGSNAVFIVNGAEADLRAVVKIYAPLCPEDYDFEREIHMLLANLPELGAPRLLHHGVLTSETRWPYVVLSFVPGEPIREVRDELSDADLAAVARDLGRRVRALHELPPDAVRALDPTPAGWQRYVAQRVPRTVAALRRETELSNRLLNQIPAFVAGEAGDAGDLVLVSGDFTEDHVLLVETGGGWRISGLIDFADARIAPRDYEWVALWFGALDRDTGALEAFFAGYGPLVRLDAAFYRRALAFTFLHEFGAEIIAQALPRRVQREIEDLDDLVAALWRPD